MPRAHVLPDGAKIAALRGEADLTQWELASGAGYGLRTIGKIEAGQPTGARTLSAVATVLSRRIQRPLQLTDLLRPLHDKGDNPAPMAEPGILVGEDIKYLDLSRCGQNRSSGISENRGRLIDCYRFRKLPPSLRWLNFRYGTAGKGIEGQCLHPDLDFDWREVHAFPASGDGCANLKRAYQLQVRLDGRAHESTLDVQNALEYVDGFSGIQQEFFHTHVAYPTEHLALLITFPADRPAHRVRGVSKLHPHDPFVPTAEQPLGLPEGQRCYWHIRAPQLGATYQMEWEW